MTSSRKHIMWKRLSSWLETQWIPIVFFLVILIHGSLIGLSDDEAYYWVLAQRPALGYAYHPPAVAWFIAFFQSVLGWVVGTHQAGLVRFPAVFSVAVILSLSLGWLKESGFHSKKLGDLRKAQSRAALVLLSFYGFFALSWMMVPDIPLFLGWMLLFRSTWTLCFRSSRWVHYLVLSLGACLLLLSKYSGILVLISSFLAILIWTRSTKRIRAVGALAIGSMLALVPILYWNSQHQWASILYQIRDRHGGGGLSLLRYFRFWLIEVLVVGPPLIGFFFFLLYRLLKKGLGFSGTKKESSDQSRVFTFCTLWMVPSGAVFCLQPLVADFKPHWAFVVWWPVALALAWICLGSSWKWIKFQVCYGVTLGVLLLLFCHIPIGNEVVWRLNSGQFNPKLDVTNDLYGWKDLGPELKKVLGGSKFSPMPVVGSRYQTASQAAFSLSETFPVTLLPRDVKEKDEWPDLRISEGQGPDWPKLKTPVLYVIDNRYDNMPDFPSSQCEKILHFEKQRWGLLAKWIEVWRCRTRST